MIREYDEKIAKIVHRHLPGSKIYLFGLKLKDHDYFDLQMNVAVDTGSIIDQSLIGNIYSDIKKELLPIDVDIVDINEISLSLRNKILAKGVLLV